MTANIICKPIKIVIADKNQNYLFALQNFIEAYRSMCLVDVCLNVDELNNMLKLDAVHVVIADILIFSNNPFAAVKNLKQQYQNIKIITLSMDESRQIKEKMIKAGAYTHLSKWNIAKELIELINNKV